jgi:hypothetical protein
MWLRPVTPLLRPEHSVEFAELGTPYVWGFVFWCPDNVSVRE